ncbi:hypothetical protein LXL04_016814 [Taraxacum kok-saghyz]
MEATGRSKHGKDKRSETIDGEERGNRRRIRRRNERPAIVLDMAPLTRTNRVQKIGRRKASFVSSVSGGGRSRRQGIRSRCGCGDPVGKWTGWRPTNPGRRFVGCPNFRHHGGEIEEVHYPHVYQELVVEAKHGEDEAGKWKFGFFVCLVVILWLIVK